MQSGNEVHAEDRLLAWQEQAGQHTRLIDQRGIARTLFT